MPPSAPGPPRFQLREQPTRLPHPQLLENLLSPGQRSPVPPCRNPEPRPHRAGDTPPRSPSGFLNKDCGLRFLLPQTHRVHTSPGAPTAVREALVARARPHLPRAAGRGGAYPGPWPGSCCRSRRGCRAGWRTPTPPGRCPPRRSRPRRSRARAARTAAWTATPPSS